ncbi:MAG: sulfurtransferase [Chloroflexota bacterium]|nr:sulfurtransferase [Chloroflexota bacterium]
MLYNKLTKIGLSVAIGALVLGILSACSSDSDVSSDTTLDNRGYSSTERLVSTKWVEDNLDNKNLKIIDIRKGEDYEAGHLPGALSYPKTELQIESGGVKGLIPPSTDISNKLSSLGVKSEDTILIYDGNKNLWSTRLLWTLDVYGHEDARMMDGSFGLWEKENRSVTNEAPSIKTSDYKFTGTANSELVTSIDTVLGSLDDTSSVVLDTRGAEEFAGRDVRANRGGHIPGAIHVNWVNNVDEDGRFLSAADLKKLYGTANVTDDLSDIYTLCQTAVRATHSWFVLADLLGFDNVSVYDGSWTEWGNREDTPIDS